MNAATTEQTRQPALRFLTIRNLPVDSECAYNALADAIRFPELIVGESVIVRLHGLKLITGQPGFTNGPANSFLGQDETWSNRELKDTLTLPKGHPLGSDLLSDNGIWMRMVLERLPTDAHSFAMEFYERRVMAGDLPGKAILAIRSILGPGATDPRYDITGHHLVGLYAAVFAMRPPEEPGMGSLQMPSKPHLT